VTNQLKHDIHPVSQWTTAFAFFFCSVVIADNADVRRQTWTHNTMLLLLSKKNRIALLTSEIRGESSNTIKVYQCIRIKAAHRPHRSWHLPL